MQEKAAKICIYQKKTVILQSIYKSSHFMKTFLKYSGALLTLAGAACLAVHFFGTATNALLVAGMVLEVVGILGYMLINKFVD